MHSIWTLSFGKEHVINLSAIKKRIDGIMKNYYNFIAKVATSRWTGKTGHTLGKFVYLLLVEIVNF